jgi:tRNA (adenine37-N6)-methyltransferase
MEFTFPAIGIVRSCFKEKFTIPRQPGLAPSAKAQIEILTPYDDISAFDGLDDASHLWIQFVFHHNQREEWKPKIKVPRLGGNKTLGVFATRSPTRPAPIGLSVVKNEGVKRINGKLWVDISGVDLLDGTPVLDIKPYLPYCDSVPNAVNRFADAPPSYLHVHIAKELLNFCEDYKQTCGIDLAQLIREILQQDPRPAYQAIDPKRTDPDRIYGAQLLELNVRWRYKMIDQHEVIELMELRRSEKA